MVGGVLRDDYHDDDVGPGGGDDHRDVCTCTPNNHRSFFSQMFPYLWSRQSYDVRLGRHQCRERWRGDLSKEGWLGVTEFLLVDLLREKRCLHKIDGVCVPPMAVLKLWMQDSSFDSALQKMTYMYNNARTSIVWLLSTQNDFNIMVCCGALVHVHVQFSCYQCRHE